MEKITLTEENQVFLDTVASIREEKIPAGDAYMLLIAMAGAGNADS